MKTQTFALIAVLSLSLARIGAQTQKVAVERRDFVKRLTLTGELQAVDSVNITPPRISDKWEFVITYLVAEGTRVQRGDLLIQFDASELETERLELENKREEAQIKITQKKAEVEAKRQDNLLARAEAETDLKVAQISAEIDPTLISRADAEKYQYEYSKQKITLEKTEEQIRNYEQTTRAELEVLRLDYEHADLELTHLVENLEHLSIRAPIPGLVIHGPGAEGVRKVQVGDTVHRGWPTIKLPNMEKLEVEAQVHDTNMTLLQMDMAVEVILDAYPTHKFRGKLSKLPDVSKARNPRSRQKNFRVEVALLEHDLAIMKPGMTARVEIPIKKEDVLVIPRTAVQLDSEGTYILDGSSTKKLRLDVLDANARWVVVRGDLTEGQRLLAPRSMPAQRTQPKIEWILLKREDLVFTVSGSGILQVEKAAYIRPPSFPNLHQFKILSLAPEGARVKEGDLLVRFDPTQTMKKLREEMTNLQKTQEEYQKKTAALELSVKDQELTLEEARVEAERAENKLLEAREFESILKVREAKYHADLARKRVKMLRRKLASSRQSADLQLQILKGSEKLYRHRIADHHRALEVLAVEAPIPGVVVYGTNRQNQKIRVGNEVYKAQTVLNLPDLSTLMVKGRVAEIDAGKIRLGQPVTVSLDAIPERTFSGRIVETSSLFIRATFDRLIKVLEIKVKLDEIDQRRMRPSMAARLQVMVDRFDDVLAVPLPTLHSENGKTFVWVNEEAKPVKREVQVARDNGVVAAIAAGLREGEEIASSPLMDMGH